MDYQKYFCFLWYFTLVFCGILLLLFAVKQLLQILQNHLMIVADGVSIHYNISIIAMIPVTPKGIMKN